MKTGSHVNGHVKSREKRDVRIIQVQADEPSNIYVDYLPVQLERRVYGRLETNR